MGEGICLRHVFVVGAIGGFAFLCKHHRHVVKVTQQRGYGYTACLYGQDFIDLLATETSLELIRYLAHDVHINLMIEKVIHLEDIPLLDNTVFQDFFFEKVHCCGFYRLNLTANVGLKKKDLSELPVR